MTRGPGQAWSLTGIVSFGSSLGCEVDIQTLGLLNIILSMFVKVGYPNGITSVEFFMDWIIFEISA